MVPKPLATVLSYSGEPIIDAFLKRFELEPSEAVQIFRETKKWLWLCAHKRSFNGPDLFMDQGICVIDQMWHCFILFTREYADFCDQYLGGFIHHAPSSRSDLEKATAARKQNKAEFLAQREQAYLDFYSFVEDHLGRQTLHLWFVDYAQFYSEFILKKVQRGL